MELKASDRYHSPLLETTKKSILRKFPPSPPVPLNDNSYIDESDHFRNLNASKRFLQLSPPWTLHEEHQESSEV